MTPNQLAIATSKAIQGVPGCKIAQTLGVHDSTISRNLNRPEIKALIEREAQEIINRGLKPARRTITRLAAMGNTKGADKDMLKLSLDASKHITSMAGLSGTTPSTIINALIQVNQAPEQSKELDTLTSFLNTQWQAKITESPIQSMNGGSEYRMDVQNVIDVPTTHTPPTDDDMIEVAQPVDTVDK